MVDPWVGEQKHMSNKSHGPPLALTQYYEANDKGEFWELWCRICARGWRLDKPRQLGGAIKAGNILHLLNHARSHPANKEK